MIYVDLTGLCGRNWTGIEKYGNLLFKMLRDKFGENEVKALKVGQIENPNYEICIGKNYGRFITEYFFIPLFLLTHQKDSVIFPIFPPIKLCWVLSKNIIPVFHDTVFYKFRNTIPLKSKILIVPRRFSALRHAKKIITVSETEKAELQKLNPKPEYLVIYNSFENKKEKSIFETLNITKNQYILSVSTLEPRKNFDYVLQVMDKYFDKNKNLKIVIVGRLGWGKIKYQPLNKEQFIFTGYISDADLEELYKHAFFFITLPIDEGFGRTPVEAVLHGIPAVVSDIPIFHEVLGNDCLYLPLNNLEKSVTLLESFISTGNLKVPSLEKFKKYSFEKVKETIPGEYFGLE